MKTLVIHPKDNTTEMLKKVYEGKGYTVINDFNISKVELATQIMNHDRIIFLGHGTPDGLINPKVYQTRSINDLYLIDDSFASILRNKETISVWCFSDRYFRRNNIKGFHTGMIISEVSEANLMLGECPLTESELYDNMVEFSQIIGECIEESPLSMKNYILDNYKGEDSITQFNRSNIIVL